MWPHRRQPTRLPHPWDSPGKNTGVGCHLVFASSPLLVPGPHPGHHIKFSCHVSLDSAWLGQFLRLPLVLMNLTNVRRTKQVLCRRMSVHRGLCDVFSWLDQGDRFGREIAGVNFLSHHIVWRIHTINIYMTYHGWCWPWWPSWCSVCRDSPLKSWPFPLFPYCAL